MTTQDSFKPNPVSVKKRPSDLVSFGLSAANTAQNAGYLAGHLAAVSLHGAMGIALSFGAFAGHRAFELSQNIGEIISHKIPKNQEDSTAAKVVGIGVKIAIEAYPLIHMITAMAQSQNIATSPFDSLPLHHSPLPLPHAMELAAHSHKESLKDSLTKLKTWREARMDTVNDTPSGSVMKL